MNNHTLSDITVDTWVQGGPLELTDLIGSVVLIEVFQVNCPGCFIYSLPRAVDLYQRYHQQGLAVIGLATAFEDYDKNTLENLKKLMATGEVIGETFKALDQYGLLSQGKLSWKIPFAVGMDRVVAETEPVTDERVLRYAHEFLPNFEKLTDDQKKSVLQQVRHYLEQKSMRAETFERFALQGTPSCILFDRKGALKDVSFGQIDYKQAMVEHFLAEK
ncbi:TlpA family protein disulfide reductase [Nitrosomonas sp.]|uniref:TlpA family protein disulfide reductase n=1 Tax=Nitrosomonas sp. TaxID=42353 RepID=UPI001D67E8A3|nr:TlpA family protein disulfide reductase [Nitrosomonas sp.]MBX3617795.1 TlpA family protein disulfide reductase [Nitrosomonas sp.]